MEIVAREMVAGEINIVIDYFHSSTAEHLEMLGVDPDIGERLIGSIRRECLDHIVVLGEEHLRRILKFYADCYNGVRTHRSLNKDAPVSRPVQRTGVITSHAILGGLHHQYVRV